MAKQIKNDKNFLVIECSVFDLMGIEPAAMGICDRCNSASLKGYICCALGHQYYCEKCYQEWISRATRFDEDIPFETSVFNQYKISFESINKWENE